MGEAFMREIMVVAATKTPTEMSHTLNYVNAVHFHPGHIVALMVKILAFKSPRAFECQRTLSHLDLFASRTPVALSTYQNQQP